MNLYHFGNRYYTIFKVFVLTIMILFCYTNCSENNGFTTGEEELAPLSSPGVQEVAVDPEAKAALCEEDLIKVYQNTFYPIFSANCSISCHDSANPQHAHGHGSKDFRESYQGFKSLGLNRILEIADPLSAGSHDS